MSVKGVKIVYDQKKDWKRFLRMADDRDKLEDTWKDWHEEYKKMANIN
ncbi:MAG: hypothetical protein OEX02_18815 [Cyclobacteriaceae bacterium]|nr:hypothetical protein [Cyclobacteriaceae bacterium]